jgi:hypothetical protein
MNSAIQSGTRMTHSGNSARTKLQHSAPNKKFSQPKSTPQKHFTTSKQPRHFSKQTLALAKRHELKMGIQAGLLELLKKNANTPAMTTKHHKLKLHANRDLDVNKTNIFFHLRLCNNKVTMDR